MENNPLSLTQKEVHRLNHTFLKFIKEYSKEVTTKQIRTLFGLNYETCEYFKSIKEDKISIYSQQSACLFILDKNAQKRLRLSLKKNFTDFLNSAHSVPCNNPMITVISSYISIIRSLSMINEKETVIRFGLDSELLHLIKEYNLNASLQTLLSVNSNFMVNSQFTDLTSTLDSPDNIKLKRIRRIVTGYSKPQYFYEKGDITHGA